ncbi:MAG: endonuclease/exonuclease/phosphatase family protein [Bacteriovoracaceae bacterium]|nr:endonuclease/exonuclease/phosphatase family protein [Bacteriovoracaceae bacterium]
MLKKSLVVSVLLLIVAFPMLDSYAGRYTIPRDRDVLMNFGNYGQKYLNPQRINILVWNVFKGKKQTWREDYFELLKDKDIAILQEAYLSDLMLRVFDDLTWGYKMAVSFIKNENNIATGVATASIASPINSFFKRSPGREPVVKTPKMTLFTEYKLKGMKKTLMVVNIHALNVVSLGTFKKQIKAIIPIVAAHNGPLIWAGDFNTWLGSKVSYLLDAIAKLGLKEVHFAPDDRTVIQGLKIDYIFTKGLNILSSKVYGSVRGSDHKAMSAIVSVN